MSALKDARVKKKQARDARLAKKYGKNQRPVTSSQKVPAFYLTDAGVKVVSHEEIAGRCMHSADMMLKQTNRAFLKFYAEPKAIPLCYMLFAYHQNAMITSDISQADVVVEIYEQEKVPHFMGTKDSVVYLALFKDDEGVMPWLI